MTGTINNNKAYRLSYITIHVREYDSRVNSVKYAACRVTKVKEPGGDGFVDV